MTEPRAPTPGRRSDATSPHPGPPVRRTARAGLIMLGFLLVASVPLVALGQRTATAPPPVVPRPDAGVLSPVAAPDAGSGRPFHRTETRQTTGAVRFEAPEFECLAVKTDEHVGHEYPVPLPPFSRDVFPCSRCHDKPTDFNMTPRNLTIEHLDVDLNHGPREQWCYGCHNPSSRDTLRLAGGREISFLTSYELCGQCHGEKLRDWRLGIHGRRAGCWNGKREYLLCVHCHDPHSPKFKPLRPEPRPRRPSEIQLGGAR